MEGVTIKKYQHKYHQEFKEISLDWLKKYSLYEEADNDLLDHPLEYIKNGSTIFLAHYKEKVVGTISLVPIDNDNYEILKLGVVDGHKGLGIGKKLLQICIDISIEKGIKRITLESSSKLESALKLYLKLGFKHIEVVNTHFETADVKMELKLR
jgi:ribosomal protein S18 acetylase RimI-like enzyme